MSIENETAQQNSIASENELKKDEPETVAIATVEEKKEFIDESIPTVDFHCESCGMKEKCHLKSLKPSFVSGNLQLREESYIMRDPFAPPPPFGKSKPEYFLILGADCAKCTKPICKDQICSFFYGSTFCIPCAQANLLSFPKGVQTKLKKQISSISH